MITFTSSPLSFTFTHVWARWLLAGLGALVGFVGLDFSPLTCRWLSAGSQAYRQVNFGVSLLASGVSEVRFWGSVGFWGILLVSGAFSLAASGSRLWQTTVAKVARESLVGDD
jgi:hypothetical protein